MKDMPEITKPEEPDDFLQQETEGVLSSERPWLVWLANLFRTIGIIPGGLGIFETASVMSLKSIGMPLEISARTPGLAPVWRT